MSAGPIIAAIAAPRTRVPPIRTSTVVPRRRTASGGSLITDARIEEAVRQIDEEIHRDVGDRDEQNAALHRRVVARANRLDQQTTDAGPGKNRFRNYRTPQPRAQLK